MRKLSLVLVSASLWMAPGLFAASFDELASKAAAARDAGEVPQAIDLYRQALKLNANWQEGWWFLGTLAYDSDQYPLGEHAFSHFVRLDGSAAPGWAFLGLCEFENGHIAGSLEHLRKSLKLGGLPDATETVVRFHEAMALTKLGFFDQALQEFLPFARRGTKSEELALAIGLMALRRPLLPGEAPPAERDLFVTAGKIDYLWMAGDLNSAEAAFPALLAGYPNAAGVHNLYGTFLLTVHPDEAVAEFRRELEVNPHSADARAMLALTMIRAGDDAQALPLARQATADGPSAALARYVYGLLLARTGDRAALAHLEAAVELDPANLEYHMALAGADSKFGQAVAARRERAASIGLAKASDPRVRH